MHMLAFLSMSSNMSSLLQEKLELKKTLFAQRERKRRRERQNEKEQDTQQMKRKIFARESSSLTSLWGKRLRLNPRSNFETLNLNPDF